MASLGRYGRTYEKIDLDFDWFEAVVRVNPNCSQAALVEFLDEAGRVDQQDEIRGAQLIMRTMREVIHPDDFDRFWVIAKRERQDPQEDILPIARQVMEKITDFPTGRPSASSPGPVSTGQRFTVDLPSQDTAADQALAMLRGRPDLQEFVVMQEEAQRARGNGQVSTAG